MYIIVAGNNESENEESEGKNVKSVRCSQIKDLNNFEFNIYLWRDAMECSSPSP